MAKDIHEEPFDEGTITKLDIFERFLRQWLPVFIYNEHAKEINIIDFFAGPGMDAKGVWGSPLRIFKVINEYKADLEKKKKKVKVILNEFSKVKCDALKENIKSVDIGNTKVEIRNEDFANLFPELKDKIKSSANLIFIDQNGIKQVSDKIFLDLYSLPYTDFLFFMSTSFIKRFSSEDGFRKHLSWMGDDPLKDTLPSDVHREVVQIYKKLISDNAEAHIIPFTIRKGVNIYGLVFCSKHYRAAEKFLSLAWKENELNGEANFDIDKDGEKAQLDMLNPKMTKLEAFEQSLEELILSVDQITNVEIYKYTISSGFLPQHAKNVLIRMKNNSQIERFSYPYIGYDQCFKKKNIVHFKRK